MFGGPLPEWVLVGRWRIQNNTIVGSNTAVVLRARTGVRRAR